MTIDRVSRNRVGRLGRVLAAIADIGRAINWQSTGVSWDLILASLRSLAPYGSPYEDVVGDLSLTAGVRRSDLWVAVFVADLMVATGTVFCLVLAGPDQTTPVVPPEVATELLFLPAEAILTLEVGYHRRSVASFESSY